MSDRGRAVDQYPVTLVILVAYLGFGIATGLFTVNQQLLHRYGALNGALVAGGEPWRLLAHAFLHYGALHLLMNTLALMALGPALERHLGSLRYIVLYAVSAVGGGLLSILWFGAEGAGVGGSGALFGMLGALVATQMRAGRTPLEFFQNPAGRRLMAFIFAYLIIGALVPFISNTGHLGGLIAGFAATFFFLDLGRARIDRIGRWHQAALAALFVSLVAWVIWPATRWDSLAKSTDPDDPDPTVVRALGYELFHDGLLLPHIESPDQATNPGLVREAMERIERDRSEPNPPRR